MDPSRSHPAYHKHHEWIINALIALMQEKNYAHISIKDIVTRADVSRQTFYRHFPSKDAIVEEFSQNICRQLTAQIDALTVKSLYAVTCTYFHFWLDYRDLLNLLIAQDCEHLVYDSYQKIVGGSIALIDQLIKTPSKSDDPKGFNPLTSMEDSNTFTQAFIIGGLYNMKIKWMENGYKQSPEEMAQWVDHLFNHSKL